MPRYTLYPCSAAVALADQVTSTEWEMGVTPAPLRGMLSREEPLLERDRLPERAPAVVGVNTTVAVTLCPAASVRGVVSPVLKPGPVTESCVMVAEELPELAIFTVCVSVLFNAALPNDRLAGVAVKMTLPGAAGVGDGVGEGEGLAGVPLDAVTLPLPPQPINISMLSVSVDRKNENCRAVVCSFTGVAPAFC